MIAHFKSTQNWELSLVTFRRISQVNGVVVDFGVDGSLNLAVKALFKMEYSRETWITSDIPVWSIANGANSWDYLEWANDPKKIFRVNLFAQCFVGSPHFRSNIDSFASRNLEIFDGLKMSCLLNEITSFWHQFLFVQRAGHRGQRKKFRIYTHKKKL